MSDTTVTGGATPPVNCWNPTVSGAVLPGMPLYVSAPGFVSAAKADDADTAACVGLAQYAAVDGARTFSRFGGLCVLTVDEWDAVTEAGTGGLVDGAMYYVSAETVGKLTTTPPGEGDFVTPVGVALSNTALLVQLSSAADAGSATPLIYNLVYNPFDPEGAGGNQYLTFAEAIAAGQTIKGYKLLQFESFRAGTGAGISGPVGSTMQLTSGGGASFSADMIGRTIDLEGDPSIANTGSFTITNVLSATLLEYTNAAGVADPTFAGRWDVIGKRVANGTGDSFATTGGAGAGVGDSLAIAANGIVTLTDSAAAFTALMLGNTVTLAGSTTPANNGAFLVTEVVSATQIRFTNTLAVAEAFPGTWTITSTNVTLTDAAALFTPEMIGMTVTVAGSTTPANNGSFLITFFVSATQVKYLNAAGVAEAFSGTWTMAAINPVIPAGVWDLTDIEPYASTDVGNTALLGSGGGLIVDIAEGCEFENSRRWGGELILNTLVYKGRSPIRIAGSAVFEMGLGVTGDFPTVRNTGTIPLFDLSATLQGHIFTVRANCLFQGPNACFDFGIAAPVASGVGDNIANAAGVTTLTDAAGLFTAAMVGMTILIAGSTTRANSNAFAITTVLSATQVKYANAGGVTEAFSGTWSVFTGGGNLNFALINSIVATGAIKGLNPMCSVNQSNHGSLTEFSRQNTLTSPFLGIINRGSQTNQLQRPIAQVFPLSGTIAAGLPVASAGNPQPIPTISTVAFTRTTGLGHNANLEIVTATAALAQVLPMIRGAANIANGLRTTTTAGALDSTGMVTTFKHRAVGGVGSLSISGDLVATGTGDSLVAAVVGGVNVMTLTDAAAAFTAAMVGRSIYLSGSTTPANDSNPEIAGSLFLVTSFISATQVTFSNPIGVTEAFPGTWTVRDTIDGKLTAVVVPAGGAVSFLSDGVSNWRTIPANYGPPSPAYTITNVATDRAYDASTVLAPELANVLGTLIADLKAKGILG